MSKMNPTGNDSTCCYCRCTPCIWNVFSGDALCICITALNCKHGKETKEATLEVHDSKKAFVDSHNNVITLLRSRMLELWKEYFGIMLGVSDMKKWSDFVNYGDHIMEKTPPCIRLKLYNALPYYAVDANNNVLVCETNLVKTQEHVWSFKQNQIPALEFVPNKCKHIFLFCCNCVTHL